MNDYVLSTDDYMYFYPYVMPREIKEEFGSYSIIARNIQKLYKKHGLISADDALDMIIERSYAIADLDISHEEKGIIFNMINAFFYLFIRIIIILKRSLMKT